MSESPTHRVAMTWDQHERSKHDLLFEMSKGYMHAAIVIFEEQRGTEHATFYNLLPGHFALQQSVELFLKAAMSLKGIQPPITHNLKRLHSQYQKLFPGKELTFQCRIGELINWNERYANGQDARYPFDQEGKAWLSHAQINIESTLEVIGEFFEDFERLEPALRKAILIDKASA
ncbi:MAG: HEPN domain-containing protein [Chloroflexi bacterium]|nr:HEPN domain-containing protein [Chloroflexota bacterium]